MARQQIVDSILAATAAQPNRLRSWSARMGAKAAASAILGPLVPDGTLGWLAFPGPGESRTAYASRAVSMAAARASWAGGLTDGTHVCDTALATSIAAVLHAR